MFRKAAEVYDIYPDAMDPVTERLYWIRDGQHEYALKQSSVRNETLADWENVYHRANKHGLRAILPVYLTKDSSLSTLQNQHYYYLTPWIPANSYDQQQQIKELYDCIGRVHAKTKQSQIINTANITKHFMDYQKNCLAIQNRLLKYVELFERNRFMSPFELLVCTHYQLLDRVFLELNSHIDQLLQEMETEMEWSYSLCHGNLDISHVLHQNHSYLTNWEKAKYENVTVDLSTFLINQAQYDRYSSDHLLHLFSIYTSHNTLTKSEVHVLAIHLLDPHHYIQLIQQYNEKKSTHSMLDQTRSLQYAMNQLTFGLRWAEFMEKETDELSEDEQET